MTLRANNHYIALYKSILRLHRTLPTEFKIIGNAYIKSEFKKHKEITDEKINTEFLYQWMTYRDQIASQKINKGNLDILNL